MEINHQNIVAIHALTGLLIFLTGFLQFLLKKGTRLHRIIGYTYFISWFVIIATGAAIGSLVVVAIVVLGFYLAIMAIRSAVLKNKPYAGLDRIIVGIAAAMVLFLMIASLNFFVKGNSGIAILSGIFFLLYLFIIGRDFAFVFFKKRILLPDRGKFGWYVSHMVRMQFSFVTALSAFVATQNVFGNTILNFTLPGFFAFFIIRWNTRQQIKKLGMQKNPKIHA
jgi:hypothetical protein